MRNGQPGSAEVLAQPDEGGRGVAGMALLPHHAVAQARVEAQVFGQLQAHAEYNCRIAGPATRIVMGSGKSPSSSSQVSATIPPLQNSTRHPYLLTRPRKGATVAYRRCCSMGSTRYGAIARWE